MRSSNRGHWACVPAVLGCVACIVALGLERVALEVSALVIAGVTVLATILDVSDVRRAESNAHELERRFRELAEAIDEVFWINNPQLTKVDYISPAYERIWGRSCERLYESPRD